MAADCVFEGYDEGVNSAVPKYPCLCVVSSTFLQNWNKSEAAYSEVEINDTHYTRKKESNL